MYIYFKFESPCVCVCFCLMCLLCKEEGSMGAGEVAQMGRALAVLVEDLALVPCMKLRTV